MIEHDKKPSSVMPNTSDVVKVCKIIQRLLVAGGQVKDLTLCHEAVDEGRWKLFAKGNYFNL